MEQKPLLSEICIGGTSVINVNDAENKFVIINLHSLISKI